MLEIVQTALQVIVWFLGIILILLILVQGGAGDLSSTFGGGGQLDSSLGVGASRKMGKLTGWLSVAFLATVFILAMPSGRSFAAYADPDTEDASASTQPATGVDADGTSAPATGQPEAVDPAAADALSDDEIEEAVEGVIDEAEAVAPADIEPDVPADAEVEPGADAAAGDTDAAESGDLEIVVEDGESTTE